MTETKLIRLPEVESRCGLKKSCIYQLIKNNKFPIPVRLGSKSVAWKSDEIQRWIDQRPRTRPHQSNAESNLHMEGITHD